MTKSKKNKTIVLNQSEVEVLSKHLVKDIRDGTEVSDIIDKIILGDILNISHCLPSSFVDLLILDTPYNLNKDFGGMSFKRLSIDEYLQYFENIILKIKHTLKPNASIYVCGDWYTSTSLHMVLSKHFNVQNRITWQREKGRGAKKNWKNSHEDIYFATMSKDYTFNVDKVKTRKRVIAPYKVNGVPKDWQETEEGNFRDTYPSNFWNDLSIPYWSMAENTEHPTQKPEKLLAKLILASSNENDIVFDPFLGSGTSCVVAKKLARKYLGVEINEIYASLSMKRVLEAKVNDRIQGYNDGVFWERNSLKGH